MTATMTSLVFSNNISSNTTALWKADIYDYDNEVTTIEVEAYNEDEAHALALDAAASMGIDANYILIYRY